MNIYLSAHEAASELGISTATLYAYVSRGMIRAEAQVGSRKKLYAAADVRALKARHAMPEMADKGTLELVETALTLIHNNKLYYRGVDMESLAPHARLEAVASLLWNSENDDPFAAAQDFVPAQPHHAEFGVIGRQISGLAAAADADLAAHSRTPEALARTGARIMKQMVASTVNLTSQKPIHEILTAGWANPKAENFIRTALVAMADHELAASTLAVRVAASTGATPWRAVTAGLCALDGSKHGRANQKVQRFLSDIETAPSLKLGIASHLALGDPIPGFGHRVYKGEDPRNRVLMAALPKSAMQDARTLIATVKDLTGLHPNLDFALAFGCKALNLPREAPKALFAISRAVGWICHIIEQEGAGTLLRFRARYVGPLPA